MSEKTLQALLIIAIAVVWIGLLYLKRRREKFRSSNWITTTAEIIGVTDTQIKYGEGSFATPLYEIKLEITNPDNSKRIAIIKKSFDIQNAKPKLGNEVEILINPKNSHEIIFPATKF